MGRFQNLACRCIGRWEFFGYVSIEYRFDQLECLLAQFAGAVALLEHTPNLRFTAKARRK
jgi:hypothetical protein